MKRVAIIAAVLVLLSVVLWFLDTQSDGGGYLDDIALISDVNIPVSPPANNEQNDPDPVSIIIKGIEYSISLKSLDLSNMQLTTEDIKPLVQMTNLTWLNLENNQINGIYMLAGLTGLTNLYLSDNQFSDISALAGLTRLSDLGLAGNRIVDISALAGLAELKTLNLSHNQIRDIRALAGLDNLWELWLDYNQISSVSALEGLTSLSLAALRHNQIEDADMTKRLAHVPMLYLEGNPIKGFTVSDDMLMLYNGPGGDVIIPDGVKKISREAFWERNDITSVFIPDSVTSIIDDRNFPYVFNAFRNCTGILNITVSDKNLTYSSHDGVLFNKDKTTLIFYPSGRSGSYIIPDGVRDIGGDDWGISSPFLCYGLTSIFIPDSVEYLCWHPFNSCPSLTDITVSPGNGSYSSLDGVLFNKDKTILIEYPPGKSGDYTIPDGVTGLGDYAFFNCEGLTSVIIPEGVTSLDYDVGDFVHTAFINCVNLERVVIPRSVTNIDDGVFFDCPNITIHSYADSEAQRYAEKKGIPFVEIK